MTLPEAPKEPLRKRKAWVFSRREAPTLASLLEGAEARRKFWRYWVKDNFVNGIDLAVHFGLKLMPMDTASNFGAWLGPFALPRFHKTAIKRGRATLARLLPDKSQAERDALLYRNWQAQGRLMTEFSAINRLRQNMERIQVHDLDNLTDAKQAGPVVLVGMHLGNWEIGSLILNTAGIQPNINYTPPSGRAKAWISARVRRKAGVAFMPPGSQGTRASVKVLKDGGLVSMFCDEGVAGKIRGPLFGRPPHQEGNLAVAVRLARMTGAKICPWYNLRGDGFRFDAYFLPPIELPPEDKPGARLAEDILMLNAVIEPVISAHLDQWYFLDNSLPEG
jgi:KDO2-lipid IV(A) lauroyltransferase